MYIAFQKKVMKNSWIYLICISLCIGCIENKNIFNSIEITFENFEKELLLQSNVVPLDTTVMGISSIFLVDRFLLFLHSNRSSPYFFSVYDIKLNKFAGRFLNRGRGPSEFISLAFDGEYTLQNGENWLYLSAINEQQLYKFNLTSFLQSGISIMQLLYEYEGLQMRTRVLNDTTFLAYMFTQDKEGLRVFYRKFFSTSDNKIEIDLLKHHVHNYEEFDVLWTAQHIRPDKKKMALAMDQINRVHIIDLDDSETNISITPKGQYFVSLKELSQEEPLMTTTYYTDVKTTQDYIFALFQNQLFADLRTKPTKPEIHVFDWDGVPLYKLHFEERLRGICIDTVNKLMYGYDDYEIVYQYDLSQIL